MMIQKENESMRGSRESRVYRGSEEEERKKSFDCVFTFVGDVFLGQTIINTYTSFVRFLFYLFRRHNNC